MTDMLTAAASLATAIGVIVAAYQIRLTRKLSRTQFEDDLTKQFREIIKRIPVEALIGEELDDETYDRTRDDFFRYFDLSNEQVFLRQQDRVSEQTWKLWCEGMRAFLSRPAFQRAWQEFTKKSPDIFQELRKLERKSFETDPYNWGRAQIAKVRRGEIGELRLEK